MIMSKSASLTSGLVAKKGQAAPAVALIVQAAPKHLPADYYKALTVKLDRDRYETLKNIGVKLDKKSQEIFVEALDLWLKQAVKQSA
jgi:hypothetical protein